MFKFHGDYMLYKFNFQSMKIQETKYQEVSSLGYWLKYAAERAEQNQHLSPFCIVKHQNKLLPVIIENDGLRFPLTNDVAIGTDTNTYTKTLERCLNDAPCDIDSYAFSKSGRVYSNTTPDSSYTQFSFSNDVVDVKIYSAQIER